MGLLYTPMKIFHYPEKLASLPPGVDTILPPLHVRLKPTNVCNHNCWYCAYRADNMQLGQDMKKTDFIPKDKMMEIIGDLIEMKVGAVTFSGGGEPFCYPHLLEAVEKLAVSPVKFAALSNGARVQGQAAEAFAAHGTWLRISIDGWDDESYAEYRRTSVGEFSKVMANIENFKKYQGPCYLGISLIIDRKNWPHIYELTARLKGFGVDSIKLSPCITSNSGLENREYHAEIYEETRRQIDRIVNDLHDEEFEIFDSYHQLDERFDKKYTWCPYIQILPVIGADMNVYTCQDKAYNLDCGLLGSLKDQSFREFWSGSKETFFQIDPARDCRHHCCVSHRNELIVNYLQADEGHLPFV